jgi:hypothetical protein
MADQKLGTVRTLVKFGVQTTTQIAGKGASTVWEMIEVPIGTGDGGKPIMTDSFYCEWLGSYGAAAIQQQADGVKRAARVRLPFVQKVYDALTSKSVRVYLRGKTDAAHTFVLASDADDYGEQHKFIEFQVKHYEGK